MLFLALEKDFTPIPVTQRAKILKDEATMVLRLYERGIIRQIYFTEEGEAVLILEAETKKQASAVLGKLPLVKHKFLRFDLKELRPYTGFSRLLCES